MKFKYIGIQIQKKLRKLTNFVIAITNNRTKKREEKFNIA